MLLNKKLNFPAVCLLQAPQLTLAEKEQLKEAMLQVMARGTRDVEQEAQFVKIKVSWRVEYGRLTLTRCRQ